MGLNDRQWEAVSDDSPVVSVQAGPGTGKTHTLVCRAAYLIGERGVAPSDIGCVTFTNKAAREMRERLASRLAGRQDISRMTIGTFHAICLRIVRAHRGPVVLLDEAEAEALAGNAAAALGLKLTPRKALEAVSAEANGLAPAPAGLAPPTGPPATRWARWILTGCCWRRWRRRTAALRICWWTSFRTSARCSTG